MVNTMNNPLALHLNYVNNHTKWKLPFKMAFYPSYRKQTTQTLLNRFSVREYVDKILLLEKYHIKLLNQ